DLLLSAPQQLQHSRASASSDDVPSDDVYAAADHGFRPVAAIVCAHYAGDARAAATLQDGHERHRRVRQAGVSMIDFAKRSCALALAAAVLAGCASATAQPGGSSARPAYVDMRQLVAKHPFAGALAQDDRLITALRATESVPGL